MPANRRPVDREEKRADLVRVAAGLFTDFGPDQTSMAQVATAAGVTTNTLYWYFDDKDALLVAVLDALLADALQEHSQHAERPWEEQVAWAVTRLERFERLVSTVHVRSSVSTSVAEWHERFHALADALLEDGLRRSGVAEQDVTAASRIGTFVVEGLLSHPQSPAERTAVLRLLSTLGSPTGRA